MSDDPSTDPIDGDGDAEDLTAAEYALGVLDRQERAAAEARSAADPEFARQVLAWVVRFAPLIEGVAPVDPSPAVWSRIESAIVGARVAPGKITAPPAPANDDALLGRIRLWRTWAVGASAVAAAALLFIAVRPALIGGGGQAPGPIPGFGGPTHTLVATLSLTQSKASAMTVAYDPVQSRLYASPDADFSIPRARSAELWLIPADGKPRPMGLVDPAKPAAMPMPPQFRALAKEKATLALSIEPAGGSTTGLPTGPVVAAGALTAV
jgi:anti-sigma-K factor RskA